MSSASRTKLLYATETTYGTAPTTPAMYSIPYNTGDAFTNSRDVLTSSQVQSTRQPRSTRLGTNQPEKTINGEMQWSVYDTLIAGGMGSSWVAGFSTSVDVTVLSDTITRASGSFITDGFAVGDFILFDDNGTDKVLYLSAVTATDLTCEQADTTTAASLTTEAVAVTKTFIVGSEGGRIDTTGNTVTFAASGNTVTRASGSWITDGFKRGMNIYFDGTTNNEGWHKISTITATVLTMESATITDESATTIDLDYMTDAGYVINGNTLPSFTFEEQFLDHTTYKYRTASGVKVAQLGLSFQPSARVALTMQLLGASITDFVAASIAGSEVDYSTVEQFDTFTGFLEVDGSTACVTSTDVTLDNGEERQFCLFDRDANNMIDGTPTITGNTSVYFNDNTYTTMYYNETQFDTDIRFEDPDGNAYLLEIENAKFTGDTITINDNDVTEALPYTVEPNSSGSELKLWRQPAAR